MFFALRNLRDQVTFEIEKPWEDWDKFPIPPEVVKDHDAMVKWRMSPKTQFAFISGIAGVDSRARVTKDTKENELSNPPRYLHAVVADYDAACRDVDIRNILDKPPTDEYFPNYICDTYRPGHKRLIWVLEKPLLLTGHYGSALAFGKYLMRQLKMRAWLPGFDEDCVKPGQYFSIGRNWEEIQPMPLPHHIMCQWASVSDATVSYTPNALAPPPIEDIAELVADRFPGRWDGAFEIGRRGTVFFNSDSTNPTSAVVFAEGMRTFSTGTKGFYTWEEIFGQKAIDSIRGDTQGIWRERVIWAKDHNKYWVYMEHTDEWIPMNKDTITNFLACKALMDDRRPKGGGRSQLDQFLADVTTYHSVDEALPFIFHPQGRMLYNGDWYLNISKLRVLPPAPPLTGENEDFHTAGPKAFPWLHGFLTGFFCPVRFRPSYVPNSVPLGEIQLWFMLAWLHRFYKSAYRQKPLPGQAVVIGGPPGRGKGLLTSGILSKLMGGSSDSAAFLVNEEQWTSEILRKPIMTVDDDTTGDDVRNHRKFTTKLKKIIANAQAVYNKKFGTNGRVKWLGRVTITCNLDPDSLRILPDLNQGNADKIMLFQAGEGKPLEDMNTLDEVIDRELPHFARWLLEWTVPKWLLAGDERFWVRPYHHETMLEAATEQGSAVNMLEMLREVYDVLAESSEDVVIGHKMTPTGKPKSYVWSGPVRQLYRLMRNLEVAHAERMNMQQIGTLLGVLSSRGFKIRKLTDSMQDWEITFDPELLHHKRMIGEDHGGPAHSEP